MMNKVIPLLSVLICVMLTTGCISTNVKAYTDTQYQQYNIRKMAVRAPDSGFQFGELLEKSMVDELEDEGVKAGMFIKLFPPTREWTNEQVTQKLLKDGFDSIMYINLGDSDTSSNTIGYINHGTASVYGNTASFNSYSTPVVATHRYTSTRIKIYSVKSGELVWVADANTSAGGLLYIGDSATTESIAEDVVESLKNSGHM